MRCDRCDKEATVHEVTVHKGQKVEKHLCEDCAKKDGIAVQSHAPINALLSKFVMSAGGAGEGGGKAASCPNCGMTWGEFRQHGLLGCAECYGVFEAHLGPLLERAQEGATHHVGKTPTRAGGSVDRQRLLASLRKRLNEAIAAERYEQAAKLRDELREAGSRLDSGDDLDADRSEFDVQDEARRERGE